MALKFNLGPKVMPKILINIGCTYDIPTGTFITGNKGESILNGGLGQVTGAVGGGNNFKSTTMHYMMLSAANRMWATADTAMSTYDTEINISINRLEDMANKYAYIPKNPITEKGLWDISDKTSLPAEKWFNNILTYTEEKKKDKSIIVEYTAFKDPYGDGVLKMILPTFGEIDSLSEFEAESTMNMVEKDIEDANTVFMKQGLFKTKVVSALPRIANSSNTFFLVTAQIGEKIDMATGPAKYNQPSKKLQHLKGGDTIKGVSGKFFYLLNNGWFSHTASVLKNPTTKLAEYPTGKDDTLETDLNIVKMTQLRSKSGPSGYTLEIIVSQKDGVLPTLTEFHHIKTNGKFGIGGNDRSYFISLYPDVSLSRTTVRSKIDSDPLLRRAINISSELLQMHKFHNNVYGKYLCTPEELYDDIKKLGYDWNILLRTREWWTIDQYTTKVPPFLSILDLLKMRKEEYFPYFLNDDKTIKKEYKDSIDV